MAPESKKWLRHYGYDRLYTDRAINELGRPKLIETLLALKTGDELILPRPSNAVRGSFEMTNLLEICRIKGVRLISIEDRLDTKDILFPNPTSETLLNIMCRLPMEVIELRKEIERARPYASSHAQQSIKEMRLHRDFIIVNMYLSGHTLEAIRKRTGIAESTLYCVLRRHGISPRRNQR